MEKLFYLISKILPSLTLPLGTAIILIFIGLLRKSMKYIFLSLIILYSFSTKIMSEKLINFVEMDWQYKDINEIPKADSAVVLSGEIKKLASNKIYYQEWNDPDRFFAGINLIKNKKARKLIFTGGVKPFLKNSFVEGELLKQEALLMGLLPEEILISENVLNTYQESIAIKNLLLKKNLKKQIILVTSAFHMNRARFLFEKQNIDVIPYPVDFKSSKLSDAVLFSNPINWFPDPRNLYLSSICLREIFGRVFYYLVFSLSKYTTLIPVSNINFESI